MPCVIIFPFVLTIDHPSLSISSFMKSVLVSLLYLNRPSLANGFSANFGGTSQKVGTLCELIHTYMFFAFFVHVMNPLIMRPFGFPSPFLHKSFPL